MTSLRLSRPAASVAASSAVTNSGGRNTETLSYCGPRGHRFLGRPDGRRIALISFLIVSIILVSFLGSVYEMAKIDVQALVWFAFYFHRVSPSELQHSGCSSRSDRLCRRSRIPQPAIINIVLTAWPVTTITCSLT